MVKKGLLFSSGGENVVLCSGDVACMCSMG